MLAVWSLFFSTITIKHDDDTVSSGRLLALSLLRFFLWLDIFSVFNVRFVPWQSKKIKGKKKKRKAKHMLIFVGPGRPGSHVGIAPVARSQALTFSFEIEHLPSWGFLFRCGERTDEIDQQRAGCYLDNRVDRRSKCQKKGWRTHRTV